MKLTRSIDKAARLCRSSKRPIVLVPTMGALHRGHATLIERARHLAGSAGFVVVSIFVNRKQFGPTEDFAAYPRTIAADRALCTNLGVNLLLLPREEAMYSNDFSTIVSEENLSRTLCGASRPGHFQGVCTVVAKLLHITGADVAVFGRKDLQQCMVIQRMVRNLNIPVSIQTVEIAREDDGLAMSSRNRYLTREERRQAPVIRRSLQAAATAFYAGESDAGKLRAIMKNSCGTAPLARIDYLEVVDANTLLPVHTILAPVVCAAAVFLGTTRLIDNLLLKPAKMAAALPASGHPRAPRSRQPAKSR